MNKNKLKQGLKKPLFLLVTLTAGCSKAAGHLGMHNNENTPPSSHSARTSASSNNQHLIAETDVHASIERIQESIGEQILFVGRCLRKAFSDIDIPIHAKSLQTICCRPLNGILSWLEKRQGIPNAEEIKVLTDHINELRAGPIYSERPGNKGNKSTRANYTMLYNMLFQNKHIITEITEQLTRLFPIIQQNILFSSNPNDPSKQSTPLQSGFENRLLSSSAPSTSSSSACLQQQNVPYMPSNNPIDTSNLELLADTTSTSQSPWQYKMQHLEPNHNQPSSSTLLKSDIGPPYSQQNAQQQLEWFLTCVIARASKEGAEAGEKAAEKKIEQTVAPVLKVHADQIGKNSNAITKVSDLQEEIIKTRNQDQEHNKNVEKNLQAMLEQLMEMNRQKQYRKETKRRKKDGETPQENISPTPTPSQMPSNTRSSDASAITPIKLIFPRKNDNRDQYRDQ